MEYQYITALMLAEGSEAGIQNFLNTMENQYGFANPLPLIVPLAGFASPFPPDRVDRKKLQQLEELEFSSLENTADGVLLSLIDDSLAEKAAACLRGIHGREAPAPLSSSLFPWKGVLVHPAGLPFTEKQPDAYPSPPPGKWHTYRYALLKIQTAEQKQWWRHLEWEILWSVRKARKT